MVDVVSAVKTYADLVICIFLFAWIIIGVAQGPIRRLLGMVAMLLAFIVAANVRDNVGEFLKDNWTQFGVDYNKLIAFIAIFVVVWLGASALIQLLYHRTELSAEHPIVDDVLGGFVGLVEGLVLLLIVVIVMNSYALPVAKPGDLTQLRDLQNIVVNNSDICDWIRGNVAPAFVHILGTFLPADLVSKF